MISVVIAIIGLGLLLEGNDVGAWVCWTVALIFGTLGTIIDLASKTQWRRKGKEPGEAQTIE